VINYVRENRINIRRVILGICMENDLKNYDVTGKPTQPRNPSSKTFRRKIQNWIRQHSAIYLALSYNQGRCKFLQRLLEAWGFTRSIDQLTHKNSSDREIVASSARSVISCLEDMANAVVLIIPSRALWHGNNQDTELQVHSEFVNILVANQVRLIDMKPIFEKIPLLYSTILRPMLIGMRMDMDWPLGS